MERQNLKPKTTFVRCSHCGKKIIQRLSNGTFIFAFGKDPDTIGRPPVYIEIYGSLKIQCLRKTCQKINILHFFPFYYTDEEKMQAFEKSDNRLQQSKTSIGITESSPEK